MMQLGKYAKDDEDQKRKTSKGGVEFKKKNEGESEERNNQRLRETKMENKNTRKKK